MSISSIQRTWTHVLAAATLSLGLAAPANAIIYVGTFDPAYDNPGDTYDGIYGYRGEAKFSVSDDCLASDGFHLADTASCGALSVLSATLTLYEISEEDSGEPNSITLDMVGESAVTVPTVYGVVVKNGKLDGVVTNYFGGIDFVLGSFNDAVTFDETLWMRFYDTRVSGVPGAFSFSGVGSDPVDLCNGTPGAVSCGGTTSNPSNAVTFNSVPEPMSAALVGLALAVGGLFTRRQPRRSHSAA